MSEPTEEQLRARAVVKEIHMATFGLGFADGPAALERVEKILRGARGNPVAPSVAPVTEQAKDDPETERVQRKGRDRQERGGFDRGEG